MRLFGIALTVLILGAVQAQAQSLGVTPASVDAKVKRGTTYTQTFTLSNNSSERMRFACSISDYWYDGQNKRVLGAPGSLPRSASLWVQFSPAEILVEPNSSATVKAIIAVPKTASGGYYTLLIFEATPVAREANLPQSGNTTVTASVGVCFRGLAMLTTEDNSEYNVEVVEGQASPPSASSPLEMKLDLKNRSTTHVRIQGVFALLNEAGKLAGRGKIESKRYMPGQRDILKSSWTGDLPPGNYTLVVTLKYDRVGMDPATLVHEIPFIVK
jgi:hypothetical protein